jgi:hypothetical protein
MNNFFIFVSVCLSLSLSVCLSYPPPNLAAYSQVGESRFSNQEAQCTSSTLSGWTYVYEKVRKTYKFRPVKCNSCETAVRDLESRIVYCKETEAFRDLTFWPGSQRRVLVLLCRETRALFSGSSIPENSLRFLPHHSAAFPWPQSTLNRYTD